MKSFDQPNYIITQDVDDPKYINYDIFGLHKKRFFNYGELFKTEYYVNYDGENYSDLAVVETRTYTRDSNNLVQYRTQLTEWFKEDGSVGCTKTTIKYYNAQESISESETRRENLVSDAQLYALSQIGIVNCWDFLQSLNNEIILYVKGATQFLFDAITNSNKEYIDSNLKSALIVILTIA